MTGSDLIMGNWEIVALKMPLAVIAMRHDGVRGTVNHSDYRRMVVWQSPGKYIEVRAGRIDPDAWDYGYQIILAEVDKGVPKGAAEEKFPGEGEGWFGSENDALLFALNGLRGLFRGDADVRGALCRRICELTQISLF